MSKLRLSNSAINKYLTCAFKYKMHYINKIRPTFKSGALLFGSALDEALNELLLTRNMDEAINKFEENWEYGKINRDPERLQDSVNIRYADSDFDEDLLEDFDMEYIKNTWKEADPVQLYKDLKQQKKEKGFQNLDKEDKKFFNEMNWLALRRKGLLMLQAYNDDILPRIQKVYKVQKQVTIDDGKDNEIIGYIDLVADIVNDDGEIVKAILDNKTSSRQYTWDSVRTSPQLALYSEIEDLEWAGFLVLYKNVNKNKKKVCSECGYEAKKGSRHLTCNNKIDGKRCDSAWIQSLDIQVRTDIILDKVPEKMKEAVLEIAESVVKGIKYNIFPKDFQRCDDFGSCEYKQFCHYGDDSELKCFKGKK